MVYFFLKALGLTHTRTHIRACLIVPCFAPWLPDLTPERLHRQTRGHVREPDGKPATGRGTGAILNRAAKARFGRGPRLCMSPYLGFCVAARKIAPPAAFLPRDPFDSNTVFASIRPAAGSMRVGGTGEVEAANESRCFASWSLASTQGGGKNRGERPTG